MVRAFRSWTRRPSGRLTLPGVLLLVLIVAAAAAGAIVIPMTSQSRVAGAPEASATPGDATPSGVPTDGTAPLPPGGPPVTGGPTATPGTGQQAGGRPADVLAGWATQVASKVGDVPVVAMQAYGYTELVLAQTRPNCKLAWTTLAAIGKVESDHGRTAGATLGADGLASPPILGPVLNGTNNTQRIVDTDDGTMDGDISYDRAVGPMQFIPSTWRQHAVDANNDGLQDVSNIFDAALAAGNYLCQGSRNMGNAQDWWNAILSYNDVRAYAQDVFDRANEYGSKSHA
jgi:hypothetical protein